MPLNIPNQQFAMDPPVYQQARTVTHSKIFWLIMDIGFTAVPDELSTAYTDPQGFSVLVRAAWSDLLDARVRFTISAEKREYSESQIPMNAIVGYSGQYLPLRPWEIPIYLKAQSLIRGDWINTGGDDDGHCCFYGELVGKDQKIYIKRSQLFWLLADLSSASLVARTAQLEDDVLVLGAACHQPEGNNPQNAITAKVVDNGTNEAWSAEQIPILAMASPPGASGSVNTVAAQPVTRYHRPYLLTAFNQLRVEYSAAATNQYMAFLCERLLA